MRKVSQGMLLLTSVILTAGVNAGMVPSCSYKMEKLPIHSYPLDFSCREQLAYNAKTDTRVALCLSNALKHASKVDWSASAEMQPQQKQVLLSQNTQASTTPSEAAVQKQRIVVSCQFARSAINPARGLLRASAQSTERCVPSEIIV